MVRIAWTVPKTALAGVMLEAFQALNDHVQRENGIPTFRLFGLGIHMFKVRVRAKERCGGQVVGKHRNPGPWLRWTAIVTRGTHCTCRTFRVETTV